MYKHHVEKTALKLSIICLVHHEFAANDLILVS